MRGGLRKGNKIVVSGDTDDGILIVNFIIIANSIVSVLTDNITYYKSLISFLAFK